MSNSKISTVLFCQYCNQTFLGRSCSTYTAKYCSQPCKHRGRLWGKIDTSGGPNACWEWQGPRHPRGYGRAQRDNLHTFAHRLAFSDTYGTIPPDKQINHHCNNPPCCNPRHLYAGTQKDNVHDEIHRGTFVGYMLKGEQQALAKLTEADVEAILDLRGFMSSYEIIRQFPGRFSVNASAIRAIWNGRTWKHIPR